MSDAGVQTEVESGGTSSATQPLAMAAAISEMQALSILQLNDITLSDTECDTENDLELFDFSLCCFSFLFGG